jgi:NodT family efflux transporter outer membrane factor (OMF) lipoprotein
MRNFALLPLVALVAACTMGPDYKGPPASAGSAQAGFARAEGAAAAGITTAPALATWWTALGDPTLDALQTRALASNPGIAAAQARVRQARGALRMERGNARPSGSVALRSVHADLPGIDLSGDDDDAGGADGGDGGNDRSSLQFYNAGLDASWEVDLFGGQRRTTEAAAATLEAAEANVADAQVRLTADVAQAYVGLRDAQARVQLTRRTAELQGRMLDLTRQREARGTASALDVERLRGQLRATEARVTPQVADTEAYMNALAVLVGEAPGALDTVLGAEGALPLPPASVAVGDPAALLQRRPDVRAAERRLAAATAKVGAAKAALFPRLSLMGIIGLGGTSLSALTDLDNIAALAIPQLQWNVLDFGRGNAHVEQARGGRDEAEALYRQAVLTALRDAEDALTRFGRRREALAGLARVKASADRSADLTQQRYRAGTATLIDALDAERQRVTAEQDLAAASAGLTGDFVALQKALGLGWKP